MLAAGGLSALGSIGGSLLGSSSAADAAEQQRWASGQASAQQRGAFNDYRTDMLPYTGMGYNALPYYEYAATGMAPQGLSESELSELQRLQGMGGSDFLGGQQWAHLGVTPDMSASELQRVLSGLVESSGTSHASRHWNETFNPILQKVQGAQSRIDELTRRQTAADRFGEAERNGTMDAALPNFGAVRDRMSAIEGVPGGMTMESLQNSPMYQAAMEEMQRRTNRMAASGGRLYSSDAQDMTLRNASGLLGDEYNRRLGLAGSLYDMENQQQNQTYGRLADAVNVGRGTSQNIGQAGMGTAQNIGSNLINAGNAMAQGTMQQGQIMGNMASNLGALPLNMMAMNAYSGGKMF
jgi:hypothetical protein